MIPASEALARLREGNRRYVAGAQDTGAFASAESRRRLVDGQAPFAAILGCSDSRVPVELVFDQGPGDLFVVRVAGNVAAPSQIGSVEFATKVLGARLVVVLGHSRCGAVKATLDALRASESIGSENLHSIVSRVQPAVEGLLADDAGEGEAPLLDQAVRANVRAAVEGLQRDSDIIRGLVHSEGLVLLGAEYALETGEVDFFDGVPEGW